MLLEQWYIPTIVQEDAILMEAKTEEEYFGRIPEVPCTQEELLEDIRQGEEDIKTGRVITHDELKKLIATW